ncbi:MAG TPA: DNA polymerase domain-containing protein [Kofleriaceae bacterium]|nr:DNA polymerase domain-containing protein [Kofleriaceae bacterium]
MASREDEWLWGWDPTPGIVSVWAEPDGRALVWRRLPGQPAPVREEVRFRPWILLASLDDLAHARPRPDTDGEGDHGRGRGITYRELDGPGELRFLVSADDLRSLTRSVLRGAERRLRRPLSSIRELGQAEVLALSPEEQYLVGSGRNYFRELPFDQLRRAQLDLETTGLDPDVDRVFLIAVRGTSGEVDLLEAAGTDDAAEADLLRRLVGWIQATDPDVIENHNLHGFDLPFLVRRARLLGVALGFGRAGAPGLRERPAARGAVAGSTDGAAVRRVRFTTPGRELIDTLDAVRRYDFATRDLPGHGLKAVARHLGLARGAREHIPGVLVHEVYRRDPARVRRYAADDVHEAAGVARMLGGSAFALARMAPRRYERLADAGPATGVLDPLLVRAYLRSGAALPAHQPGDGTPHSGAALHLFAAGVAHRVVKADVASLYPSLMREYRIGPRRDRLGVLLALVDRLVDQRLAAKARARAAPPRSPERYGDEALSAAMKIVVNSAYGYLGAVGLTRFADVHAANEVTRRGREVLALMCRELAGRGVTLLEADTDGVYFASPDRWSEADDRRAVDQVAALLPAQVHLELDGRYAAMLSHEPKNYALLPYDGPLVLRGVAFRSSRAEPFGEEFLRRAISRLLVGDIAGVQAAYVDTVMALRRRALPTHDVTARVRLSKSPAQYLAQRGERRELPYEAMLTAGRTTWAARERARVYRAVGGRAGLLVDIDPDADDTAGSGAVAAGAAAAARSPGDPRDYDIEYYLRVLRETFAARLVRAFTPDDFAAVFADPRQPSLFAPRLSDVRAVLTVLDDPVALPT